MATTPARQTKPGGSTMSGGGLQRARPTNRLTGGMGMPGGGMKQPYQGGTLPGGGGGMKQPGSGPIYSQPFIPRNGQYPGMEQMPQIMPGGGGMRSPGGMYGGDAQRMPMPQIQGGGQTWQRNPMPGMQQGQVNPAIQQAMMRMLMQRFGMGGGVQAAGTQLGMGRPTGGMMQSY